MEGVGGACVGAGEGAGHCWVGAGAIQWTPGSLISRWTLLHMPTLVVDSGKLKCCVEKRSEF